ncbi:MAG TPA: hypothetical protein VFA96_10110, partial [Nocardioides sp.]|nr:hypothetical protein [Nocardioides sp.]
MKSRRVIFVALIAMVVGACSSGSGSSSSSSGAATTAAPKAKSLGDDPGNQSAGNPQSAAYTPTGTLIADNGFRPDKNGFPFENYGANPPRTNLTADDVHALFGDAVCANGSASPCDLIPEGRAWMDSINNAMGGGHCYGFSVAAELLYEGKIAPATFGAQSITGLSLDNNTALQRQLAVNWAF